MPDDNTVYIDLTPRGPSPTGPHQNKPTFSGRKTPGPVTIAPAPQPPPPPAQTGTKKGSVKRAE